MVENGYRARTAEECRLVDLAEGEEAVMAHGLLSGNHLSQLRSLGFCEGRRVRMIRRGPRLIVEILGSKIGLDSRIAERICIAPSARD